MRFSNVIARLAAASVLGLAVSPAIGYAQQRGGVLVEPIDISSIQPQTHESLTKKIKDFSAAAQNFAQTAKKLDDKFDGSPEQATRICLVKLKALEKCSLAIPMASAASENFRWIVYEQRSQNTADQAAIQSQLASLRRDLQCMAGNIRVDGNEVHGAPDVLMRMAKKIEFERELCGDLETIQRSSAATNRILKGLDELDNSLNTYSELLQDEVRRQAAGIQRNRIAKQSSLLSEQASSMYDSVASLRPAITSMGRAPAQPVTPEMTAPTLPASIQNPVTPAAKAVLLRYLQSHPPTKRSK